MLRSHSWCELELRREAGTPDLKGSYSGSLTSPVRAACGDEEGESRDPVPHTSSEGSGRVSSVAARGTVFRGRCGAERGLGEGTGSAEHNLGLPHHCPGVRTCEVQTGSPFHTERGTPRTSYRLLTHRSGQKPRSDSQDGGGGSASYPGSGKRDFCPVFPQW